MYLYGFVLQVGVIRPILSRDYDSTRAAAKDAAKVGSKEQSVTQQQQVNRNNKANKVDKELHQDNKKETLIIEKDPLFVPIESWKENNTQVLFPCVSP